MKSAVYLLAFLMVGIGIGVLVPVTKLSLDSRREAERLQHCTQYHALLIRIGDQRLTLPSLDNADVRMHGTNIAQNIQSEELPDAEPGDPLIFCVPGVMGTPPYAVTRVRLHGSERSRNFGLDPSSDLSEALSAFGPVYSVHLSQHGDYWDQIAGESLRSLTEPAGRMAIRRTQLDRFGFRDVVARSGTPDRNGFRYSARCVRWDFPDPRWSCHLKVADDVTGIVYSRALYSIPDDADLWTETQPVPQSFVDFALDMRRLVEALATPDP